MFYFLQFFHRTLVILPHIKDISIPTFLKIIKLKTTQLKHSISKKQILLYLLLRVATYLNVVEKFLYLMSFYAMASKTVLMMPLMK